MILKTGRDFSDALIQLYETAATATKNPHRQINFKSKDFEYILDKLNTFLLNNKINDKITYEDFPVKYKDQNFPNSIWQFSSADKSWLSIDTIRRELQDFLMDDPLINSYIEKKVIVILPSTFTIYPAKLKDNTWTSADLENYGKDEEITSRMNEIETRMFKRDGDTRDSAKRIKDFAYANNYEKILPKLNLKNISNLKLAHSSELFSLDPDYGADFTGDIVKSNQNIEGKAYFDSFWHYTPTPRGRIAFGNHFNNLESKGKLGSLHSNTDYILYINKATGEVICINRNNYNDNWLVGIFPEFKASQN